MKKLLNSVGKGMLTGLGFAVGVIGIIYAASLTLNDLGNKTKGDALTLSMWNSLVSHVQDLDANKADTGYVDDQVAPKADTTYVDNHLANKADIDSPSFSGTPKTTEPAAGDNSSQIPTTQRVNAEVANATAGGGTFTLTCATREGTLQKSGCPSISGYTKHCGTEYIVEATSNRGGANESYYDGCSQDMDISCVENCVYIPN